MTVLKLTGNKKGIIVIDDDGNAFYTTLYFVQRLINEELKGDFLLMSRMPNKINDARFKKSPLYNPVTNTSVDASSANSDALSVKARDEKKQTQIYNTDVIL